MLLRAGSPALQEQQTQVSSSQRRRTPALPGAGRSSEHSLGSRGGSAPGGSTGAPEGWGKGVQEQGPLVGRGLERGPARAQRNSGTCGMFEGWVAFGEKYQLACPWVLASLPVPYAVPISLHCSGPHSSSAGRNDR